MYPVKEFSLDYLFIVYIIKFTLIFLAISMDDTTVYFED